jgi:adenylate cyclase
MEYMPIGDHISIASHTEALTKVYSVRLLISEFTCQYIDQDFIVREIDRVPVGHAGRTVTVFELMAGPDQSLTERINAVLSHYKRGLEAYKDELFEKSLKHFKRALKASDGLDKPSQIYVDRCQKALGE